MQSREKEKNYNDVPQYMYILGRVNLLDLCDVFHPEDGAGRVEGVEGGHLLLDGLQPFLGVDPAHRHRR